MVVVAYIVFPVGQGHQQVTKNFKHAVLGRETVENMLERLCLVVFQYRANVHPHFVQADVRKVGERLKVFFADGAIGHGHLVEESHLRRCLPKRPADGVEEILKFQDIEHRIFRRIGAELDGQRLYFLDEFLHLGAVGSTAGIQNASEIRGHAFAGVQNLLPLDEEMETRLVSSGFDLSLSLRFFSAMTFLSAF